LQQSLINLDKAYKNFFKEKKGFPKFKSKHQKQSVRFPVDAISGVNGNRINIINDLKDIHYKCSKNDEKYLNKNQGLIKSGTLSKTKSGNYYFSILIDKPNKTLTPPINEIVGIDLGIKTFVMTSEGRSYDNLKIKRNNKEKLKRLNQLLSRKQKGSKNKEKTRKKLAKFHEKLNNQKEYYLHSIVNQLLNENQVIVMEDLNVKGMMKNHKLAKSIQELSLNRFKEILKYKAGWYKREMIFVDRWFASSKLCSCCDHKNDELTLKDREWVCTQCGTKHDRDLNAAINIRNEGNKIKIGLSSPKLTPLESCVSISLVELGKECKIINEFN
jgi:putative transposase